MSEGLSLSESIRRWISVEAGDYRPIEIPQSTLAQWVGAAKVLEVCQQPEPKTVDESIRRVTTEIIARHGKSETVNHPSHYGGDTPYEAIKVIEAWNLGFHLGNTVKYIKRAGVKKPGEYLEDLKKARWYLDRKIAECEKIERAESSLERGGN